MRLITFQAPYQTATAAVGKLGERAVTPDGRIWKYVQNSVTTATTAGAMMIPDSGLNYQTTIVAGLLTATANSSGQVVFLTSSNGGLTPGAFEEGWAYIYVGTGEGTLMKVKTNSATVIEVYPAYALAATTTIDATSGIKTWNPNVVQMSGITAQTQVCTGIAQIAFATSTYGWLLERGYGIVTGTSLVAGHGFGPGGATPGYALIATTAKGPYDQTYCGTIVIAANDASKNNFVFVNIT